MSRNPFANEGFPAAALNSMASAHEQTGFTAVSVTPGEGDMEVDVSGDRVYVGGSSAAVPDDSVTLADADPDNDRVDLIVVDENGNVSDVTGAAATEQDDGGNDLPEDPDIPADSALAAAVYVGGGVTEILAGDIDDEFATIVDVPPFSRMKVFESDTTWSIPEDADVVLVEAVGGGGAGGRTASDGRAGGGGGGGGYVRALVRPEAASWDVAIGAGGDGSTSENGSATTIETDAIVANGGSSGASDSGTSSGGTGGGASVDESQLDVVGEPVTPDGAGGAGGIAVPANGRSLGGAGGASQLGGGARGIAVSNAAEGTDATAYGAGGGGAARDDGSGSQDGGDGADGVVIVRY